MSLKLNEMRNGTVLMESESINIIFRREKLKQNITFLKRATDILLQPEISNMAYIFND